MIVIITFGSLVRKISYHSQNLIIRKILAIGNLLQHQEKMHFSICSTWDVFSISIVNCSVAEITYNIEEFI